MATQIRPPEPQPAVPPARTAAHPRSPEPRGPVHLWKRLVLGPALPTAQLKHERLGKPTALAVFASDDLSSSAYATEEILHVAVPAVGCGRVLAGHARSRRRSSGVLAILVFSYRQTIKAYPSAGGAYIVTKDNFGLLPGPGRRRRAAHRLHPHRLGVDRGRGGRDDLGVPGPVRLSRAGSSVVFIWFIACGNLRGVRESGRIFAVPTYFFVVMMLRADRHRRRSRAARATCIRRRFPSGRRREATGSSGSSWCCTRSPPAARP